MKLTIAQDHQYAGSDFWNWRAWIAGKPADLDRIEKVKWFLHPSFSPSLVVSRDRSTGFRLERSGWGSFTLRAEVRCVDGSEQTLRQPLKLFYPDEEAAAKVRAVAPAAAGASATEVERIASQAAERSVHNVYLSYAYSDRPGALAIRRGLESLGMAVVDGSAIGQDQPLEFAIQNLVTGVDATVAYVSSDGPSPYVVREINASIRAGKPTLVVSGEDLGPHTGVPPGVKVLRLDPSDASGIAAAVTRLAGPQPR